VDTATSAYTAIINSPGLNLEPFERRCALLWAVCDSPDAIARALWPDEFAQIDATPSRAKRNAFYFDQRRRVRFALQRVVQVLEVQEPRLRAATTEFRREILDAVRNSRSSKRSAQTYTGVKPYGALDDEAMAERRSWPEYRAAVQDPANYQEVAMRGPMVTAHDLPRMHPAQKLLTLLGHLGAQAELATA